MEDLPVEILEQILFSITDLRSLYHLVVASPAASRVFGSAEAGPKALDHVFGESMAPEVITLVSLVSLIRTASLEYPPAPSVQDFVEKYTQCHKDRDPSLISAAPSLAHLLRGQPPHLIRGVLLTARRICCLTWACLEYYRSQWASVTPCHLENGPFAWGARDKAWRENPQGRPYTPQPLSPPCWMEEQRVMRGFWRLQLLLDLKLATSADRLDWALKNSDEGLSPDVLFAGWTWQKEEFLTVVDFVDHIQGGSILSQRSRSLPAPSQTYASSRSWQDPAYPGVVDPRWPREVLSKDQPPCWMIYIVKLLKHPYSPIRGVPFWPYRQLGLAIWQQDKLEALELSFTSYASRGIGRPTSRGDIVFTWRSLLSQDLIAELQASMEADFQQNGFLLNRSNPNM
ncbi:hypothetical protein CGCSCA4_v005293 [Colletotrichum siamense]|uniref:F-box domain-containing protein n=1 Tax=Colletotrichum siamense TaxID=690259 RepID=A0A9P5EWS8_COLSI|nr:hypothetical protein CGCSCA4_v005293 [Colletotrichum siamense]KAF4861264.1 hypothetical protein CGCSCA2_v004755 [Colletotrichum siamense]